MNRNERRQKMRELEKVRMTPMNAIQSAYEKGYAVGREQAERFCVKAIYASFVKAAHEQFGFGKDRAKRLMKKADRILVTTISCEESMQEVYDQIGLRINFKEVIDRVEDV